MNILIEDFNNQNKDIINNVKCQGKMNSYIVSITYFYFLLECILLVPTTVDMLLYYLSPLQSSLHYKNLIAKIRKSTYVKQAKHCPQIFQNALLCLAEDVLHRDLM